MSGYIVILCIIATAFVTVYGRQKCPLTYKDCGSGLSKIINVLFSGIDCPSEGAPAVVPRGSTVQVYAEFIPHVSTPTLTASIHACLGFICLPFPLAPTDACQDSNITCPVKSGVQYTYAPVIQIKNYLPWVSACVKWELKGARGEVIGCVKFPVKIV
ncbi:ecdysteroid-regulated 16 kDa protein-like [Pomacea canaliculata]|uniref:ecdysteroid-regulated 16 kDa protein-like n=1 Tax=Pomacea canaliculata TaxID=400727 RepID=UPI000D72676D|nr:ecdysteroid-regulated 16 kDa protein-like [Pomacea canaliculata]